MYWRTSIRYRPTKCVRQAMFHAVMRFMGGFCLQEVHGQMKNRREWFFEFGFTKGNRYFIFYKPATMKIVRKVAVYEMMNWWDAISLALLLLWSKQGRLGVEAWDKRKQAES